ncbi:STAS/SEC14 domain-containing protein [Roseibacterium sp. SDUM158016]|uniref:STAS/SEC14 domain-containing protein n=1 Tax=Roseicyclus sediminis TaxID=2980997 RepID=UPI0021D36F81|nr:STAS/SEC14 domain-containing protein [Roseibacterium sp. SDUM158016]MCU4651472.1 STAS/SEC14 domain-containing protein [Roseibacterium sp. SDUM158016]
MLQIMEGSEGKVVGVRAGGKLTEADYKDLLPKLQERFSEFGRLNVLFYADETFEGWNMEAAWEDASFGFAHIADFERLALVGAPEWVVWCVKLSAFLFKGEVRIFDAGALDAAWAWVRG